MIIRIVETEATTEASVSDGTFNSSVDIADVRLWDVFQPNLYNARIQILDADDKLLDEYTQRFGVRTVEVKGNRFLLNGKPVYLQGFGRHEDFPIIGKGLNHSVNLYPGWYHLSGRVTEAKEDLSDTLEKMYTKFKKPIFITEFGADTISGMHSLPAEQWSEEYQVELIMGLIEVMRELDYVIGEHVWNFADFRTAQNFLRAGGNKKGVFTRERQPKMVAHFLKKKWEVPRYASEESSE